jgi:hypothetical protein
MGFYLSDTRFSYSLAVLSACCARIFTLLAAVLASIDGWWRQRLAFNAVEDCGEQFSSDSHLGKLERHVFRVPYDHCPDLDETYPRTLCYWPFVEGD